MKGVQLYSPNVSIGATRGWCLKYVDDAGSAPKRTPNARAALNTEIAAKRIRGDTPPVGVWVVGFLDLRTGQWAADDHVFFMKYLGNGRYEIRDSEVQGGGRGQYGPYTSIEAILAWFAGYAPIYAGWSTHCDGRQYVKLEGDKPVNDDQRKAWARETRRGAYNLYLLRGLTIKEYKMSDAATTPNGIKKAVAASKEAFGVWKKLAARLNVAVTDEQIKKWQADYLNANPAMTLLPMAKIDGAEALKVIAEIRELVK